MCGFLFFTFVENRHACRTTLETVSIHNECSRYRPKSFLGHSDLGIGHLRNDAMHVFSEYS